MIAHGLAHTLRRLGMVREAEEVAYAWREPLREQRHPVHRPPRSGPDEGDAALRRARTDRALRPGHARAARGEGAQALAWYAYNSCQFDAALEWFHRGVAWFPKEATVYGYALTLKRLKRQKEFLEIVNRYDGLFPKVVELLFPEERPDQPPTPCEQKTETRKPEARTAGDARGQPLMAPPDAQQPLWSRVPKPSRRCRGVRASLENSRR